MNEMRYVQLRVVMPVHNGLPYLSTALESVLQDLPLHAELVVVDDGSTDGSTAVVEAMAKRDPRVRLLRHTSASGVSRALNAAIQASGTFDFVAVAEHDDVVLPGRFAAQVAALRSEPALGAVSSEGRYIGPRERIVGRVAAGPSTHAEFVEMKGRGADILVPHPAVTYRAAALSDSGLYDPDFDGAQDLELINRIVYQAGWEVRTLRTPHVLYRIHDASMSFSHMSSQRSMTRYIRYRNRQDLEGFSALGYESWLRENPVSARVRLRHRRYDKGALFYRRAGLDFMARRPFAFIGHVCGATLLHPRWVLMKVKVALGR